MKRPFSWLALLSTIGALGGCLDEKPIAVFHEAGVFNEAGLTEAAVEDDAYLYPECRACVAAANDPGPGCGTELQKMYDAMWGKEIYNCAYLNGCVNKPTYGESLVCALPCANALGVTDVYDPAIVAAFALSKCFHNVCGTVCEKAP